MTDAQLKKIYQTACDGKGYEANEGQFKLWKQVLGWCDEADLAQALVYHFSDSTAFPMPADLKALISRARMARVARSTETAFLVRWECKTCGIHQSGYIPLHDQRARICCGIPKETGRGVCHAEMVIVYDERTQAKPQTFQQQMCPECGGIVSMMRPVGEQFRTWCVACQKYRKIVPDDMNLTDGEWALVCFELGEIHKVWVDDGRRCEDCIDPQFDRELVRGQA